MTPLEKATAALAQEKPGDRAAKACILAFLDAVIEEMGEECQSEDPADAYHRWCLQRYRDEVTA
jgi:hypothetical protein